MVHKTIPVICVNILLIVANKLRGLSGVVYFAETTFNSDGSKKALYEKRCHFPQTIFVV